MDANGCRPYNDKDADKSDVKSAVPRRDDSSSDDEDNRKPAAIAKMTKSNEMSVNTQEQPDAAAMQAFDQAPATVDFTAAACLKTPAMASSGIEDDDEKAHYHVDTTPSQFTQYNFNEKSAAAPSKPPTAQRMPGAQYIPRVAPGINPNLRQSQAITAVVVTSPTVEVVVDALPESHRVSSAEAIKKQRNARYICAAIVTLLLVAVAVSIGVSVFVTRGAENKTVPTGVKTDGPTHFGSLVKSCRSLDDDPQPHFILQCQCTENISIVAADIEARYNNLTKTFIKQIYPDFNESLGSCIPQNQALVWLASDDGAKEESRMRQRYSLALLFTLWDGANWISRNKWLSSEDECNWLGVLCNDSRNVTAINLYKNNATLDLPPVVVFFDSLEALNMSYGRVKGSTIPKEVALLSNLKTLELSEMEINGTLPTELFELGESLQRLDLSTNSLEGTIPTLIGNLVKLQTLKLQDTQFSGTLPKHIGRCSNLSFLSVDNNNMNGTIPSEIGLLTALSFLSVDENDFTGTIPTEMGHCTRLEWLSLLNNELHGTVPVELASTNITKMDVMGNDLHVPEPVCQRFRDYIEIFEAFCYGCDCKK